MFNPRFIAIVTMIFSAAAMRLLPHPPNFTPIAAIALFGGAHFASRRLAFAVPLMAMFLSDLLIAGGFHTLMPVVYICFAVTVGLGIWVAKKITPLRIASTALCGSILFFVVTNFGVWMLYNFYPKTLAGLIQCYVAAIPFFRNTLTGDLLFATMLFGGFALMERYVPAVRMKTLIQERAS